ncbi:hypothetical protein [Streptomyces sp. 769]|uniref:hypothetical protein n=1 Tax=Streptomyces sp. 769 TaxID=1262452 RepID=UPI00057E08A0|nr:hypothetical protein [Streptomyces sp. 769]AJC58622.1 hypothetical protein GZL_06049 [Streptomyces sp. 769]
MKFPADNTTLTAWSALLGLTKEQATATLADIEAVLRTGYAHRPPTLRHRTFEQLTNDMDIDEFALMFLTSGLRRAGYPEAAHSVQLRGLLARLQGAQQRH